MPTNSEQKQRINAMLAAGKITATQAQQMTLLVDQLSTKRATSTRQESTAKRMRMDSYLRAALYALIAAIFLLFTPYSHQLDEIKTAMLFAITPVILMASLPRTVFSNRFSRAP